MGLRLCALVGFALAALSSAPAYAERVEMEPASPWSLNYAENSCELTRQFSADGKGALLLLRRYAPTPLLDLAVYSADFPFAGKGAKTTWEPDETPVDHALPVFGETADGRSGVMLTTVFGTESSSGKTEETTDDSGVGEREVTGLLLEQVYDDDLFFKTGSLQGAMEAMRACTDDLLTQLGIDVEAHRTLTRKATPKDTRLVAQKIQESIPSWPFGAASMAFLPVRLTVAADGEVTSCTILNNLNDEFFEKKTCDGINRYARFDPALDAQGNAIDSYYILTALITPQ